VKAKEGGDVELKIIVTHNIGDGIRPIAEWTKLPMGSCKAFFLQEKPNFISHLKLVWHPMLIRALLVLGIGLLQNILNLLVDVLDLLNKPGSFVSFSCCMYGSVVVALNIGKTLIPCAGMLGIVHAQDMHDHLVDDLGLAIYLGVEGSGFGELGVQK
jgi:hypothetical protein